MGGKRIQQMQKNRIRAMWRAGKSYKAIAEELGISPTAVRDHVAGLSRHLNLPKLDGEEWKAVPGFNDRYLISNYGRVFTSGIGNGGAMKLLPIQERVYSYNLVALSDNRQKLMPVCELVAEAFCDGRDEEHDLIHHKDGNLHNDRADNLEWTREGDGPRISKGRHTKRSRYEPLTEEERDFAVKRWNEGAGVSKIAGELATSTRNVRTALGEKTRDVTPPCEPGEEWAKLGDPNGRYYVSSYGRVFTNGGAYGDAKLLKQASTIKRGHCSYLRVNVDDGDGRGCINHSVHRLVAKYFCDGWTPEKNCVNHKDGNTKNNHASNLEWCSPSENIQHAVNVLGRNVGGTMTEERKRKISETKRSRPNRKQRKLTDEQVRSVRSDSRSSRVIAEEYGVDKSTITRIRSGESYASVE